MSEGSPGQQKEPGSGEGGRPGSDQMPPPVDVDAVARGFGPQGSVLLNKMVHGLFDAFIPVFLVLCPPGAWGQQFGLCLNLPHGGQRGVAAALGLFTLQAKDSGLLRKPAPPDGRGAAWGALGAEVRCRQGRGSGWRPGQARREQRRPGSGALACRRGAGGGPRAAAGTPAGPGPHHHRAATVVLETIGVALGSQPYTLLRLWGPDTGEESEQGSAPPSSPSPARPVQLSLTRRAPLPHPAPAPPGQPRPQPQPRRAGSGLQGSPGTHLAPGVRVVGVQPPDGVLPGQGQLLLARRHPPVRSSGGQRVPRGALLGQARATRSQGAGVARSPQVGMSGCRWGVRVRATWV